MNQLEKKVVESTIFNLIIQYAKFFLGIIDSYLLARVLTPNDWGILLLSLSLVNTVIFFCNFFPPAGEGTMKYYIPQIINKKNEKSIEIRYFIFHIFKIRIISLIVIYILYLVFIFIFNFDLTLFQLFLILSPLIFFNIIQTLNISVYQAFQKFRLVFYVGILQKMIYTAGLLFLFILKLDNSLVFLAYLHLLMAFVIFLFSIIYVIPLIPPKSKNEKDNESIKKKEFYSLYKKFGVYLMLAGIISQIIIFTRNFMFLNFGLVVYITYFMICENSVKFSQSFAGSERSPYLSIFSSLDLKHDEEKFRNLLYQIYKYLMVFLCITIGIMLFYVELYVLVIYSELYVSMIVSVQIFLFTAFSKLVLRNLMVITKATNNTKMNFYISIVQGIFGLSIILLVVLYFNFFIYIVLNTFISFLTSVVYTYLIYKKLNFKLKLSIIYRPFLYFLLSLIITFTIIHFFNFDLLFQTSFLSLFIKSTFYFFIFGLIFYILIYTTKYITKEEFSQLATILPVFNSKSKIIQSCNKIIKKFLPSKPISSK